MKLNFIRYPGGKSRLAPAISQRFDWRMVDTYVEPFLGGGSVYLHLLPSLHHLGVQRVVLNDLDWALIQLWRQVISDDEFQPLVDRVFAVEPSVELWVSSKERLLAGGDDPLDKLIAHQMSFSGLGTRAGSPIGGFEQHGKYKVGCRWSPPTILKKWTQIRTHAKGIRHDFLSISALEFLDRPGLTYLDPPYYNQGGALYQHTFEELHEVLAEGLLASGSRWYLSYDDCPEIRKLYEGRTFHQVSANYTMNSGKGKKPKHELLITFEEFSTPGNHLPPEVVTWLESIYLP